MCIKLKATVYKVNQTNKIKNDAMKISLNGKASVIASKQRWRDNH